MTLRKVHEVKAGDRTIELIADDSGVPELFVEGLHGILVGNTHVKLNLYSVTDQAEGRETRQLITRLVMPMDSYAEFAGRVSNHARELREAVAARAAGKKESDEETQS